MSNQAYPSCVRRPSTFLKTTAYTVGIRNILAHKLHLCGGGGFSLLFFKKEIWVSFRFERYSVRNTVPKMQIIVIKEKQFFLLVGSGGGGCECLICSFPPTINHINIFGETTTDHHVQGKEQKPKRICSPLHTKGKDTVYVTYSEWLNGLTQASSICPPVPCSKQHFSFCSSSVDPLGTSAPALSGTMNYSRHPTFLHWKNLRASSREDQIPLSGLFQTEVTVLTLAERACLNLLFRSCMLGDLGLGMREVLRFSGVLLGCCL